MCNCIGGALCVSHRAAHLDIYFGHNISPKLLYKPPFLYSQNKISYTYPVSFHVCLFKYADGLELFPQVCANPPPLY